MGTSSPKEAVLRCRNDAAECSTLVRWPNKMSGPMRNLRVRRMYCRGRFAERMDLVIKHPLVWPGYSQLMTSRDPI
jgi:hypothetical protein